MKCDNLPVKRSRSGGESSAWTEERQTNTASLREIQGHFTGLPHGKYTYGRRGQVGGAWCEYIRNRQTPLVNCPVNHDDVAQRASSMFKVKQKKLNRFHPKCEIFHFYYRWKNVVLELYKDLSVCGASFESNLLIHYFISQIDKMIVYHGRVYTAKHEFLT